jgi:hypothetical protein
VPFQNCVTTRDASEDDDAFEGSLDGLVVGDGDAEGDDEGVGEEGGLAEGGGAEAELVGGARVVVTGCELFTQPATSATARSSMAARIQLPP